MMLPPTHEGSRRWGPGYCSNENKDECISNDGPVSLHRPNPQDQFSQKKKLQKFMCLQLFYLTGYWLNAVPSQR